MQKNPAQRLQQQEGRRAPCPLQKEADAEKLLDRRIDAKEVKGGYWIFFLAYFFLMFKNILVSLGYGNVVAGRTMATACMYK